MLTALALLFLTLEEAQPVSAGTEPLATAQQTPPPKSPPRIPHGTEIKLTLDETLTSKKHVKGDLFRLKVVEAVKVGDAEVLPIGTTVVGEITNAQTKSAFGISGKLEARVLYAQTPNGTIRLTGKLGQRGEGGTTETVLTYAAIGSIAFVVTGKSAVIPAGTVLFARVGER